MIALAAAVLALAASHYDDPAAGVHATLPPGWHAAPRLTQLAGPRELVTLASYPLHRGGGCGPARALRDLPSHGALVFVLEYVPAPRHGFPPRPARVRLRARDRHPYECIGRPGWLLRFRDAGRALQIHVVLGSRAGARMRVRAERVVEHLRFDRRPYRTLPPPTAEMDNETGDSIHVPSRWFRRVTFVPKVLRRPRTLFLAASRPLRVPAGDDPRHPTRVVRLPPRRRTPGLARLGPRGVALWVVEEPRGPASPAYPPAGRPEWPPLTAAAPSAGLLWRRTGLSSRGYRFSAWIAAGPRASADDLARAERALRTFGFSVGVRDCRYGAIGTRCRTRAERARSPAPYVAPCAIRVSGGLDRDYRRSSLNAGPLALFPVAAEYPGLAPETLRHTRYATDRYPPLEAVATVAAGATVTVAIAPEARPHLAMLFDRRSWRNAGRGYRIADGEAAVTFRSCGSRPYAQYKGGFVADRPGCYPIAVTRPGAPPLRRVISIARGDCGALQPMRDDLTRLAPARARVRAACARRRAPCPALLPISSERGPRVRDLSLRSGRAGYLLDVADDRASGPIGGTAHLLIGGTTLSLPLFGARGQPWPPPGILVPPSRVLRIPPRVERVPVRGGGTFVTARPPTVIGPALVGDRPALLLRAAPYPQGGIHGGHVLLVWNDARGHGRLLSLHYERMPLARRLRLLLAIAESEPRSSA